MEKKNFLWWVAFILLFIWQLPQALIGLIMMPFLGKKELIADRHFNFGWKGEKMSGGISLGPFAFISEYSSKKPAVVAHEVDGHSVDSKIMGPLYLLIIGLPSLLNAMLDFTDCYFDFYTEKLANKHAKLGVDEHCEVYFIDEKSKNA